MAIIDISQALGHGGGGSMADTLIGRVTARSGGELTVTCGGASVTCADYCGAAVGDIVALAVSASGVPRAVAVKGGPGGAAAKLTGTETVTIAANAQSGQVQVAFPAGAFAAAPAIMLTFTGGAARYGGAACTVGAASASGFNLNVYHVNSATSSRAYTVRWVAEEI